MPRSDESRSAPKLCLAVAIALAMAGTACGVGGGLAASGGGGGGGSTERPPRPTSTIRLDDPGAVGTEATPAGNLVRFLYRLDHIDAKTVNVFPEFRLPQDAQWRPMTLVGDIASNPTAGLEVKKGRGDFQVLWNTLVDLPRPSLRNPTTRFIVNVRVRFEYVSGTGETRTPLLAEVKAPLYYLDDHLAATIASDATASIPNERAVPAGLDVVSDGVLIANAKSDTVDHLSIGGVVTRRIGRGVFLPSDGLSEPGVDITNGKPDVALAALSELLRISSGDPAAVQPRALLGLTSDAAGNIYTANHYFLSVANFVPEPKLRVLDQTMAVFEFRPALHRGPAACRRPAFHPAGVLLYSDTSHQGFPGQSPIENQIVAVNPAPPGSTSVLFSGHVIAPGERVVVYNAETSGRHQAARIHNLVVGPSGEIYFDERDLDRFDQVVAFNPTGATITVGTTTVPPGEAVRISGQYTVVERFAASDARAVSAWDEVLDSRFNRVEFLSLAVADTAQLLFIGVPVRNGQAVFAVDLHPTRDTRPTFAGVDIPRAGQTERGVQVVFDSAAPRPPANAHPFSGGPINAIDVDAEGKRLLIAQGNEVFLVNGETAPLTAFGGVAVTTGAVQSIYRANSQTGIPLQAPSAVTSSGDGVVLFADGRAIRALNLSPATVNVGGTKVAPGVSEIVAGAALPGFSGDGGRALEARFSSPDAMAASLQSALFVADTGNHRVRLVHIGDPASSDALIQFGQTVRPGDVATIAGGGPDAPGSHGDGGPPVSASLSGPKGLALRRTDGVLFIADTGHHRIRAMNPSANAVTIAGTVVDENSIRTIVGDGTEGDASTPDEAAPGTTSTPTALALHGDLLFFAETGAPRIRVLNLSSEGITLGGGITVGPGQIRAVCGDGTPGDDGDGGPAVNAQISEPSGLAVSADDQGRPIALYFSDAESHVLRVVNLSDAPFFLGTDVSGRPDPMTQVLPGAVAAVSARPGADPTECAVENSTGIGSCRPAVVKLTMPRGLVVVRKADAIPGTPVFDASSIFVADGGSNRVVRFPAPIRSR